MSFKVPANIDAWMLEEAPLTDVVISSRARLARNLPRQPFAARATDQQLGVVAEQVRQAFSGQGELGRFEPHELVGLAPRARTLLRESHLISAEQEKGGPGRMVYLNPQMNASVMVNEEDHLRLSTLAAGLCLREAYQRMARLEEELESRLDLAWSEEFGYLTACPTNTGTGLRLSVMLHLPALAMVGQVDEALVSLAGLGMIVRGSYGEHTEHLGDLYQISNEVTLGRSEQQLLQVLEGIVRQVIERERRTRQVLLEDARPKLEDAVCRALGLLATARQMSSMEAATLLSRARLGIGQDWGISMGHAALSRLFVDIQPAHLQFARELEDDPEQRDLARAELLRSVFTSN